MRNSFETGAPILGVKPTVEAPGVYRIVLTDSAFANTEIKREAWEYGPDQESGDGKRHVFVAMPFDKQMDDVYCFGIESPVNAAGLNCERTDRSAFTEAIVERIKNKISTSAVVIGEMTGGNPNVYLEIGYAWGKDRHTLLACEAGGEIHRSAKHHHCIMYESIGDLKRYLEKELKRISMQNERSILKSYVDFFPNQVYVTLPNGKAMDDTFEFGIKDPIKELGLTCKRVSKAAVAADWNQSARRSMEASSLVIANLTGGDPNVYMDVGYAWAKGKPTILVARNGENLAYDVSGYKCLMYDSIMELKRMITTEVKALKSQMTG
jgi:nucleoside 2-deoxyribosyltransferase